MYTNVPNFCPDRFILSPLSGENPLNFPHFQLWHPHGVETKLNVVLKLKLQKCCIEAIFYIKMMYKKTV